MFAVSALVLVAAAIVIPKGQDVFWINGNHSKVLDGFMIIVTNLGAGLLFIPLLLFMLFYRFKYALLTAIVWVGHGLICAVLKRGPFSYLQRPRALLDNQLLYFVPNVDVHTFHSFPSGHTATMFCFAFLLSLFLRNRFASAALLLLALLVAYSRIYLLQHFLIDVAAGAAIGVMMTYAVWQYFENAALPSWMNQYIRVKLQLSMKVAS